jgi:transcriptional regulator with XRE-family HTH domain
MEIGARPSLNMRRLRCSKGWSQKKFPHQAGLHRTYVSDLKRDAGNPTITVADALAVALGVPISALCDSLFADKPEVRAAERMHQRCL